MADDHQRIYPPLSAVSTGVRGVCPRCGEGRLFASYLKLNSRCPSCGLDFDFDDAGEGAAWFVMSIAGTLAVSLAMWIELTWQPAYWVHALAVLPFGLIAPVALLRPAKGILICRQFVTHARDGRPEETTDSQSLRPVTPEMSGTKRTGNSTSSV